MQSNGKEIAVWNMALALCVVYMWELAVCLRIKCLNMEWFADNKVSRADKRISTLKRQNQMTQLNSEAALFG